MRLIAFVTDSGSIMRLLGYLGEPTQAQGIAPAVPPRWDEDFDPREGTEGPDLNVALREFEFDQGASW